MGSTINYWTIIDLDVRKWSWNAKCFFLKYWYNCFMACNDHEFFSVESKHHLDFDWHILAPQRMSSSSVRQTDKLPSLKFTEQVQATKTSLWLVFCFHLQDRSDTFSPLLGNQEECWNLELSVQTPPHWEVHGHYYLLRLLAGLQTCIHGFIIAFMLY